MYTFVFFPLLLFFPVLSYKYFAQYLENRSLQCECSFVSNTEMKTWESFVLKFNYLENKSQTYKFIEFMNKFVYKYELDYECDVCMNATHISLIIPNKSTYSFNTVVDLINSTEICITNHTICETTNSTDEEEESDEEESDEEESDEEESDEEESDEEDDDEEDDVEETSASDNKEEPNFVKLVDKMIGSIINDSIALSCEKTIKSMLSEVTKLQSYEVTDTEDIQEDNSEAVEAVEACSDMMDQENKDDVISGAYTDEFELIKPVQRLDQDIRCVD